MIYIEHKGKDTKKLEAQYPNAIIIDVTSKADGEFVKLSPFYPHGNIPVPFSEPLTATCVEGIWQGLKVFKNADIDMTKFENNGMKNLKRTVKKFGTPLGHRKGVYGTELLDYVKARIEIYLPAYAWILNNKVKNIIDRLRQISLHQDIVLLDYTTNGNVNDTSSPLSHAALVKAFIENNYPTRDRSI